MAPQTGSKRRPGSLTLVTSKMNSSDRPSKSAAGSERCGAVGETSTSANTSVWLVERGQDLVTANGDGRGTLDTTLHLDELHIAQPAVGCGIESECRTGVVAVCFVEVDRLPTELGLGFETASTARRSTSAREITNCSGSELGVSVKSRRDDERSTDDGWRQGSEAALSLQVERFDSQVVAPSSRPGCVSVDVGLGHLARLGLELELGGTVVPVVDLTGETFHDGGEGGIHPCLGVKTNSGEMLRDGYADGVVGANRLQIGCQPVGLKRESTCFSSVSAGGL